MKRLAVIALVLFLVAPAAAGAAVAPRASLTDIENDVMCPSCKEPLAVAESPQAISERNFIRGLIAQGMTKAQIEKELVQQYGTEVLGRPPAHGFNLTVYVLPPALVVLGALTLAVTLPRWRRRARAARAATATATGPSLDPAELRRLEDDLTRSKL
jgi:cytochrome c-type biogenesis protein CcmH